MDLLGGVPFAGQIVNAGGIRNQQQIGDRVGDNPVDLLGHRAVEAAQPRLDVGHRDPQFHRRERRGHGRVDVAHHHQPIEPAAANRPVLEHLLHPLQDAGRLHRVAARTDFQRDIGPPHAQFVEEDIGKILVVMLAGVDQRGHRLAGVRLLPRGPAASGAIFMKLGRAPTMQAR